MIQFLDLAGMIVEEMNPYLLFLPDQRLEALLDDASFSNKLLLLVPFHQYIIIKMSLYNILHQDRHKKFK